MPRYVDGFVLPLPAKNVAAYKKLATKTAKIWREHGALEYCETVGDDLASPCGVPYTKLLGLKKSETAVFAWIVYPSRKVRDKANAAIMKDPRIVEMFTKMKMPFDCNRMTGGGFKVLVSK